MRQATNKDRRFLQEHGERLERSQEPTQNPVACFSAYFRGVRSADGGVSSLRNGEGGHASAADQVPVGAKVIRACRLRQRHVMKDTSNPRRCNGFQGRMAQGHWTNNKVGQPLLSFPSPCLIRSSPPNSRHTPPSTNTKYFTLRSSATRPPIVHPTAPTLHNQRLRDQRQGTQLRSTCHPKITAHGPATSAHSHQPPDPRAGVPLRCTSIPQAERVVIHV